jgi:tRNA threonylcarbamoyl adenosine modification protein YeaZ
LCDIKYALEACNRDISEVTLFVASLGPGAFTGVRVTLSTIKGLAYALGKHVVGVCSLEALAGQFFGLGAPVLSALDARRGEVYAGAYSSDGEPLLEPCCVAPESLVKRCLDIGVSRFIGVGEGVLKYEEILRKVVTYIPPSPMHRIRAGVLGFLGLRKQAVDDVRLLDAIYLRRPEAVERLLGLKGQLKDAS